MRKKSDREEHPTSIRLPREIKKAIDQEAAAQQRPVTWMILEILRQWLAWHKAKKNSPRVPGLE